MYYSGCANNIFKAAYFDVLKEKNTKKQSLFFFLEERGGRGEV